MSSLSGQKLGYGGHQERPRPKFVVPCRRREESKCKWLANGIAN